MSFSRPLRIATRTSKMALAQTEFCMDHLKAIDPTLQFEVIEILSDGCYTRFKGNLQQIGGKGAFIKALEQALLAEEADLAMHSYKDVPTDEEMPASLTIPCVMARQQVEDALVCRPGQLCLNFPGATVGTSSVRRAAQLRARYPDLNIVPLRGNADTRIRKVDEGEVDAAVLAVAGLHRVKQAHRISHTFEPEEMLPAATQGVVCLQCRTADTELLALLAQANHRETWLITQAERHLLMGLGGSCHTPIAAYARLTNVHTLHVQGAVFSLDGQTLLQAEATGPLTEPEALGRRVAQELLNQGAREILDACAAAA